jgi:hypothetical protein
VEGSSVKGRKNPFFKELKIYWTLVSGQMPHSPQNKPFLISLAGSDDFLLSLLNAVKKPLLQALPQSD